MIEIRPLHEDEISLAKTAIPEGSPEPDWKTVWGVFWKGQLSHIFAMERRHVVEPMYSLGGNHNLAGFGAMTWIDGFLRAQGITGYEFFVADSNPKFQEFIAENLPVRQGREKPGMYYFRKFEV